MFSRRPGFRFNRSRFPVHGGGAPGGGGGPTQLNVVSIVATATTITVTFDGAPSVDPVLGDYDLDGNNSVLASVIRSGSTHVITLQHDPPIVSTDTVTLDYAGNAEIDAYSGSAVTNSSALPGSNVTYYAADFGVTHASGAASAWAPCVGSAGTFAQATGGSQPSFPVNKAGDGEDWLDFDGSADLMTSDAVGAVLQGNDQPRGIGFKVWPDSLIASGTFIIHAGNSVTSDTFYAGVLSGAVGWRMRKTDGAAGSNAQVGSAPGTGAATRVFFNHTGTATDIWVDGVKVVSAAAQNVGDCNLDRCGLGAQFGGTAGWFDGGIRRVWLRAGSSSDADIQAWDAHVAAA